MRVIQCTNKHFFDGDSYVVCPHCGAPAAETTTQIQQKEEKKSKGGGFLNIFRGKKKNGEQVETGYVASEVAPAPQGYPQPGAVYNQGYPMPADPQVYPMPTPPQGYSVPNGAPNYGVPDPASSPYGEDTVSLVFNNPVVQMDNQGATESLFTEGLANPVAPVRMESSTSAPSTVMPVSVVQESVKPAEASQETELSKAVRKAVAHNEEKTMSFFSMKVNADKSSNTPENNETTQVESSPSTRRSSGEPVCGWLVAISGGHFGESFELYSGKNTIGRNENNKIILNRDKAVSREHHALIIFEPKKRNYFLQPGDSSGLTYLNGDYIMETKPLKRGDVLELGESKLMFIPLCGEDFSWETYIDGEQK